MRFLGTTGPLFLLLATGCAATSAELNALTDENARLRAELAEQQRKPRASSLSAEPDAPDPPPAPGAPRGDGRRIDREAWKKDPIGSMFVPWEETAELGWSDLRIAQVKACGKRHVGLQLEVMNRTADLLYLHKLEGPLRLIVGKEERAPSMTFDGSCPSGDAKLEPGASGQRWVTFLGSPAEAERAQLTLDEPQGLARHRITFGLRKGVTPPAASTLAAPPRPPARKDRIGTPAETRYYRVTALSKHTCAGPDADGNVQMAVEVLVENFSNVPMRPTRSATFRDADGRAFSRGFIPFGGPCAQLIDESAIGPGERARGFVSMVVVPAGAKRLEMRYSLRGIGLASAQVSIDVGDVPAPPTPPKPAPVPAADLAPTTWVPPTTRSATGPGLSVTVTGLKPCVPEKKDGKLFLGVELLVQNRGATVVTLAGAPRVTDAEAYHYPRDWREQWKRCTPSLPKEISPGQKARGWVSAFEVPVAAKELKLLLDTFRAPAPGSPRRGRWEPRGHEIILPIGTLRD
ncbi:MAG: DUF4352 domain-containing protein [Myxococcota bacterium]